MGEVSGSWSDKPVVLVGGGPSLRGFSFARLAALDAYLCGVNEAMFDLPRCDAGITADRIFVAKRMDKLKSFAGELYIAMNGMDGKPRNAIWLTRQIAGKLSSKPDTIITCGTSGYAALNLAYLKQAKHVLLLGYDYSAYGEHYHDAYDWQKIKPRGCWSFWAKYYDTTLPQLRNAGIEVFNASPKSVVTAFQRGTIDEGLEWLASISPRLSSSLARTPLALTSS